jgi:hypothetical protein
MSLYPLEQFDLPETFVGKFKAKYPEKTLSVHSIIVKPGDAGCLTQQAAQGKYVRGVEGYSYARLSRMTDGKVGTICASDYGSQLRDIGYHLQGQVTSMPFACRPINDDFTVTFNPEPANEVSVTADFQKLELKINSPLPPLTMIRLEYQCED